MMAGRDARLVAIAGSIGGIEISGMSHVGSPFVMQAWLSAALLDVGDRSEANECGASR
jgi:hypothetical protein